MKYLIEREKCHGHDDECISHQCTPAFPCVYLDCPHCIGEQKVFHNALFIGVVGTRRRNTQDDYQRVEEAIRKYIQKTNTKKHIFVSGGCPQGADSFVERFAEKYNFDIKIHPANWKRYGKSAGFKRNGYIAEDSDVLIAMVADDRTGGTEDTIKKFKKYHPEGELILI